MAITFETREPPELARQRVDKIVAQIHESAHAQEQAMVRRYILPPSVQDPRDDHVLEGSAPEDFDPLEEGVLRVIEFL